MRNLLASGSEAVDAPPAAAGRALPLSAFLPTMQRFSSLSGRSRDGAEATTTTAMGRRALADSLGLGSGVSVAPATQRLDQILNEPDEDEDEDEDRDEADEADDVRGTRSAFADLVHSHLMRGTGVYRRSAADRTFSPYFWMGADPGDFGGSPVGTSSGSASPTSASSAPAGGLLTAPRPPEEIDLTVSSDSEAEAEQGWMMRTRPTSVTGVALTDGEEAQDEDVQIIGSTGEPLRRKRRRPASSTASAGDATATKRSRGGFDPNAAESTMVSMENNDVVERFKHALKCSICLDQMTDMTSTLCGHVYCARCITAQVRINGKCPLCQRRLQLKDIHPLFF